jgi:hypothetical protein
MKILQLLEIFKEEYSKDLNEFNKKNIK